MHSRLPLVICLLLHAATAVDRVEASVSCKDENNNDVDWFIMYNVPRVEFEDGTSTKGDEFAYVDSHTSSSDDLWTLSSQSIADDDNPLSYSVAPLFRSNVRSRRAVASEGQPRVHGRERRFIGPLIRAIGTAIARAAGASKAIKAIPAVVPRVVKPGPASVLVPGAAIAVAVQKEIEAKAKEEEAKRERERQRKRQKLEDPDRTKTKEDNDTRREKEKDLMYVVYNDQPPRSYNGTRNGHSKGLVIFDKESGVWIQHSVPGFLDVSAGRYVFPGNALRNGQTVMCITFPTLTSVNRIAEHLRLQYANVYHKSPISQLSRRYEQMNLLLEGIFIRDPLHNKSVDWLLSLGGTPFLSVSKRSTWNIDIYSDYVADQVAADSLLVQSWLLGAGERMGPVCRSNSSVLDSSYINLHMSGKSWKWSNTEDHSKWAVGVNKPWFCLGSLNRMISQKSRGGEVTCMNTTVVHHLFKSAHETSEHC